LLLDGMELIREAMASKLIAAGISLELSPGTGYPDRPRSPRTSIMPSITDGNTNAPR
jgi:hypothetical protein